MRQRRNFFNRRDLESESKWILNTAKALALGKAADVHIVRANEVKSKIFEAFRLSVSCRGWI
jgi:hypothetical protein